MTETIFEVIMRHEELGVDARQFFLDKTVMKDWVAKFEGAGLHVVRAAAWSPMTADEVPHTAEEAFDGIMMDVAFRDADEDAA